MIRKLWWFSCKMVYELEDDKGAAHLQLREVAVQPAEDAGVVTVDEEGLVALQFQMAVESASQHLHGYDQDAECLGEQGERAFIALAEIGSR
jgi:hypothetical protein